MDQRPPEGGPDPTAYHSQVSGARSNYLLVNVIFCSTQRDHEPINVTRADIFYRCLPFPILQLSRSKLLLFLPEDTLRYLPFQTPLHRRPAPKGGSPISRCLLKDLYPCARKMRTQVLPCGFTLTDGKTLTTGESIGHLSLQSNR